MAESTSTPIYDDEGRELIVRVEGLQKYFGKNHVLKGIDLEVFKGEVLVLIGPSGSGKSTFLRCLNFLKTRPPARSASAASTSPAAATAAPSRRTSTRSA